MPDLLWDDVRNFFDPDLMGSLPDARVADTSVEDWQAVLDLVRSQGWSCEYSEDGVAVRLPRAADMLVRSESADALLRVWPATGFLVIFRAYEAGSIDFDVNLRELRGQDGVDLLCRLLRAVRRRLGKPVMLTPESDPLHPVLGFDVEADRVVPLADPHFS
ncbi:hypothetical protein BLA24_07670 [Streptomyces cinnamoneus]|uniref:Uncharacterized protein n=1 Tax=Streptomyces cinnamoneus TaxID=53446 RepID=A0A2G1XMH8_STRCJ|nr:hypothetical protein [Streptomyces cinnamoneus]PHQ52410.1 hypothetical protein BLA24_07670 [Streptomyces cinnamoneus]PPT16254.1 hypothetical protein CYQ11_00100 [Streptomyces cinnamoneus]